MSQRSPLSSHSAPSTTNPLMTPLINKASEDSPPLDGEEDDLLEDVITEAKAQSQSSGEKKEEKSADIEKSDSWAVVHLTPEIGNDMGEDPLEMQVEVIYGSESSDVTLQEKFRVTKDPQIDSDGNPISGTGTQTLSEHPLPLKDFSQLEAEYIAPLSVYASTGTTHHRHFIHRQNLPKLMSLEDENTIDTTPINSYILATLSDSELTELATAQLIHQLETQEKQAQTSTQRELVHKIEALHALEEEKISATPPESKLSSHSDDSERKRAVGNNPDEIKSVAGVADSVEDEADLAIIDSFEKEYKKEIDAFFQYLKQNQKAKLSRLTEPELAKIAAIRIDHEFPDEKAKLNYQKLLIEEDSKLSAEDKLSADSYLKRLTAERSKLREIIEAKESALHDPKLSFKNFYLASWASETEHLDIGIRIAKRDGLGEFCPEMSVEPPAYDPNTYSEDYEQSYVRFRIKNTAKEIVITLAGGALSFTFALNAGAAGGGYKMSELSLQNLAKTIDLLSKLSTSRQIAAASAFFASYFVNLRHNIGFLKVTLPKFLKRLKSIHKQNTGETLLMLILAACAAAPAGQIGRDSSPDEILSWLNGISTGTSILLGRWFGMEAMLERFNKWRSGPKQWSDIINVPNAIAAPGSFMVGFAYAHKFAKAMNVFAGDHFYDLPNWATSFISFPLGGFLTGFMYADRIGSLSATLKKAWNTRFTRSSYFGQEIARETYHPEEPFGPKPPIYPSRTSKALLCTDMVLALGSGLTGVGLMQSATKDSHSLLSSIMPDGSTEAEIGGWVAGMGGIGPLNAAVTLRTYYSPPDTKIESVHGSYLTQSTDESIVYFNVKATMLETGQWVIDPKTVVIVQTFTPPPVLPPVLEREHKIAAHSPILLSPPPHTPEAKNTLSGTSASFSFATSPHRLGAINNTPLPKTESSPSLDDPSTLTAPTSPTTRLSSVVRT